MSRNALVTGVSGQDGWYLSETLHEMGRSVYGLIRAGEENLLQPYVVPVVGDLRDGDSIRRALDESHAHEVFNLAAISSVAQSWADPVQVADVNGTGFARLLAEVTAASASSGREIRVVQASSGEIFGNAPTPHTEASLVAPVNPYGASKAFAQTLVAAFRANGMHLSSAILYNHESTRRPERFVTRKITLAAARAASGSREVLQLGDLEIVRDWGFAPDYMRALAMMIDADEPSDYIIATGVGHTVAEFVGVAFERVGISDWHELIESTAQFRRPTDVQVQVGDPARASARLGWRPTVSFTDLVNLMVDFDVLNAG